MTDEQIHYLIKHGIILCLIIFVGFKFIMWYYDKCGPYTSCPSGKILGLHE